MTANTSYGVICLQCGDTLIAPEFSDRVADSGIVRHRWCCSRCGHEFETVVQADTRSTLSPELIEQFLPSLLVV